MVDQRDPEASIGFGSIKLLSTLFGGLVTRFIGVRGDERDLPPEDERYDYKCMCGLCGQKFDTYIGACLSAMKHYSDTAQISVFIGSEWGARGYAIQSTHWLNEARRASKDKS
jgi:hypothetical protein